MTTYEETLNNAIRRCNGERHVFSTIYGRYYTLYPFTTERISRYIDYFDLEGKSLLTVGSSSDQVINAALKGARDITLVDTCPFIRYYYYLKVASILTLKRDQLYKFLCFLNYPRKYDMNTKPLSKHLYEKVRPVLKNLDQESFNFWEVLFNSFDPVRIRTYLFTNDEHEPEIITENNLYLKNYEFYQKTRDIIGKVKVTFTTQNIIGVKLDRNFDNIWLSNICNSLDADEIERMFKSVEPLLENNGSLLLGYLYGPNDSSTDLYGSKLIIMRQLFEKYPLTEYRFQGLNKQVHNLNIEDCIMVYKKQ